MQTTSSHASSLLMEHESTSTLVAARRDAMGVAARARTDELKTALAAHWPGLGWQDLRPAESGLVMLRGRMGGDGAAFNMGEATVSRAVVALETGERGFGHVLGRDADHARLAAVLDALWQRRDDRTTVERDVLEPIRTRLALARKQRESETAATRVEFFTMVRGDA
jgi:alpha-D-ribose 1-methylphosphonate 5-triphosphate synthase subunit PhnG